MERKFYLEDVPLEEARAVFREALTAADLWRPLDAETVPLSQAHGRVTAEAVWARLSSPHFHASAMDGYAVRAEDTVGASEVAPVRFVLVSAGEQGSEGAGEKEQYSVGQYSVGQSEEHSPLATRRWS
jgi:putative molybdopterin biosynthesis protein